MKDLVELKTNI